MGSFPNDYLNIHELMNSIILEKVSGSHPPMDQSVAIFYSTDGLLVKLTVFISVAINNINPKVEVLSSTTKLQIFSKNYFVFYC